MVTATEAIKCAVHHGFLERKKKLGWRKKFYVLTRSKWIYFDSMQSRTEARSSFANVDIITARKSETDLENCTFVLVLFKKKKEYRAASIQDRDAWIDAFLPVIGYSNALEIDSKIVEDEAHEKANCVMEAEVSCPDAPEASSISAHELAKIADAISLTLRAQIKTHKFVFAQDIVRSLHELYGFSNVKAISVGQLLLESKLIISAKSQTFGMDTDEQFRFSSIIENKRQNQHHPSALPHSVLTRSKSITERISRKDFVAKQYAEEILKKFTAEKLDAHCQKLTEKKETTIQALKEEISANYQIFIRASSNIKRVEKGMADLKALVLDCRRSLNVLMNASPVMTDNVASEKKRDFVGTFDTYKQQIIQQQSEQQDWELYNDLLVCFHENNYEELALRLKDYKNEMKEKGVRAGNVAFHQIKGLEDKFINRMIDEFNIAMQCRERINKQNSYIRYLNQLGYCDLASKMCLMQYSVQVSLHVRQVSACGIPLKYVIGASRAFFNAIISCSKDYSSCFHTSSSYIAFSMWISAEIERFATILQLHVFPGGSDQPNNRDNGSSDATYFMLDPEDFHNASQHITDAFRHIFYDARQLELEGIPAAHSLAPHFISGIISFSNNYASSIKRSVREQIKNERWELMHRTIRNLQTEEDEEILLTQSALIFYTMLQMYLRDLHRISNPAYPTSFFPEVYEACIESFEDLLIYYIIETTAYLRNPKFASSLRPKQIISALTNIACIQDDCVTRINNSLQDFIPCILFEKRNFDVSITQLWKSTVQTAMEQYAHAIWNLITRVDDLDLSLPKLHVVQELQQARNGLETMTVFLKKCATTIQGCSNIRLERSLSGLPTVSSTDTNGEHDLLSLFIVDAILQYLIQENSWTEALFRNDVGWGGIHCFVAECKALARFVARSSALEQRVQSVGRKLLKEYIVRNTHIEEAQNAFDAEWMETYMQIAWESCSMSTET